MKKYLNYFLAVIFATFCGFTAMADDDDDVQFSPIHATLIPGNAPLKFEEQYGKKASAYVNGDALLLKAHKGQSVTTNAVILPVNGFEDYTLEFTFKSKVGLGVTALAFANYAIAFGLNSVTVTTNDNGNTHNDLFKKWKIPQGEVKGQVVCKIVRKKNIVSFFLNDKFVTEINVNPTRAEMPFVILASGPKLETSLLSVRIDQGPDDAE